MITRPLELDFHAEEELAVAAGVCGGVMVGVEEDWP